MQQIEKQHAILEKEDHVQIRLAGIANSTKMVFDPRGIQFSSAQKLLAASSEPMVYSAFIERMQSENLLNIPS